MFTLDQLRFIQELINTKGIMVAREKWRTAAETADKVEAAISELEKAPQPAPM